MYEITVIFAGIHGKKKFKNEKQVMRWADTYVFGVNECQVLSVRKNPKTWMPI